MLSVERVLVVDGDKDVSEDGDVEPAEGEVENKSLLLALLTNSPLMRLGMLRNGIDEIWAQPMLKSKIVL